MEYIESLFKQIKALNPSESASFLIEANEGSPAFVKIIDGETKIYLQNEDLTELKLVTRYTL